MGVIGFNIICLFWVVESVRIEVEMAKIFSKLKSSFIEITRAERKKINGDSIPEKKKKKHAITQ